MHIPEARSVKRLTFYSYSGNTGERLVVYEMQQRLIIWSSESDVKDFVFYSKWSEKMLNVFAQSTNKI